MKIAVIARIAYGARNAFGPIIASLIKDYGKNIPISMVEGNPLEIANEWRIKGYQPVILYGVSTPLYLELRSEIKETARKYKVIVGGPHAEGAYWHLLRDGAWASVIGDGENAITGLIESIMRKEKPGNVPNVAYTSDNGDFIVTRIEMINLDDYDPYVEEFNLYPPIELMRGCKFRCKFCQVPWLFKAKVRYRSIEKALEISRAYTRAGYKRIRFILPIGFAYMSHGNEPNVDAIERLLKGVRDGGGIPYLGTFPSETRPEYITPEVLNVVRRYAGNKRIAVGLQSGSDRLLRLVGRDHSVSDALEKIDLILQKGLQPVVDLIFSLPGETEEDVELTIRVMEELAKKRVRLRLHTFLPLPGSPFARWKPRPVHEKYRAVVKRLLGKGVLEGYWEWQESIAPKIYCLTALDPKPSPKPEPLMGALEYCSRFSL
ncbi:MAG: TIGR04013 family B12-binding domain/radical SAM domain-containing protein [Desulfurococcales archaeon]|nr:TIGR04013 family B12-binding domain/radical SAM domain-containing protein [Desulfurococcales archaeon]